MGQEVEFEHEKCNVWAIVGSECFDAEKAINLHVVEGIIENRNESKYFVSNQARESICKQVLNRRTISIIFCSNDPNEMRLKLAALQNNGKEVCGTCVSHFYADDPKQKSMSGVCK